MGEGIVQLTHASIRKGHTHTHTLTVVALTSMWPGRLKPQLFLSYWLEKPLLIGHEKFTP